MAGARNVDEYLAALPNDRRTVMDELRGIVKRSAPDATETIAYNMPAYRQGRHFLVSFDAYKDHYSLFPASDAVVRTLGNELKPYLSGKGTIRFPKDQPLPGDLVGRIVRLRVEEVATTKSG